MFNVEQKLKDFKTKYKSKCFALVDWKNLNMKSFSLNEMLECICNAANGSIQEMANIIEHLTAKKKVMGRTQVYNGQNFGNVDIVRDENGSLKLTGYNANAPLPLKGQHVKRNAKIFKKNGDVSKNFQRSEEKMLNFGEKVRELYPCEDNHFITFAMQSIKKYADLKKIHPDKVINGLIKGRYKLDTELWRIVPNVVDESILRHTIIINESDLQKVADMFEMTEQKFHANIRRFISTLLQDPVNAEVPYIFAQRNITRSKLLNYLLSGKDPILIRDEKISDRDENGQPKTATMFVKFRCPKKNFDRKLEKLYITMFEKNLPPRKHSRNEDVDEATGCGASGAAGGAFVAPAFGIQRRQFPTGVSESTATTNVGKYTYDAPAFGDKETLARHNGKGGSISVNYQSKMK